MKRRRTRLNWRGTLSSVGEASAAAPDACDAVLVVRGRPRRLVLRCPCGCGELLPINLDDRAGPAWRLYHEERGVSLYPSVWRESGCESHFIIWRDNIVLFGRYRGGHGDVGEDTPDASLRDAVLSRLAPDRFIAYVEIADAIDAVPWDVLSMCRLLTLEGLVEEDKAGERDSFRRRV